LAGLRDLARAYPEVRFYAISRDLTGDSHELARKISLDGRGAVTFSLLSDPKSAVIDRYGIRDPAYTGDTVDGVPKPSVFVLDPQGRVRWEKIENDYRERPTNEEIAAALDAIE
jgi:peroxiredoxin